MNMLGQALERTRELLSRSTSDDIRPYTLAPRDNNTDEMVFEVDPITRLRLDKTTPKATTNVAQISAFIHSVPDDHVHKELLAYAPRVTTPFVPEQGPHLSVES